MNRVFPTNLIDIYPDKHSLSRGACNHREVLQYKQFLKRAIKTQLTDRQSQILMLYYFNNMTMTEIADELHINKSTVSRTTKRAIDRLSDLARTYFEINK